ncbi:MAG: hypothetical protein J6Y77_07275 [Paludibacteraceae bacterium]|nr:hypothetical protein [Paludibacteraceae bacterium]
MKTFKKLTLAVLALAFAATAMARTTFTIGGDEKTYNQIRIVNRTSQENFKCRLVIVDPNDNSKTLKEYGIYELKEKGDSDSNTDKIKRGTTLAIEMENSFEGEIYVTIDYIDAPFFDAVMVYLYDQAPEFNAE